jgi:hypothetical protein
VAVLGGAAGALWAKARHRRELDLAALARFYDVYGTWFATWKACSAFKDGHLPEGERSTCLKQATAAEGQLLLIKIAIERRLSPPEVERLGRFREGYRQLRESIEAGAKLPFRVQYDDDKRNAYVAFKSLSAELAALLDGRRRTHRVRLLPRHETWGRPTLSQGQKKVVEVTSWRIPDGVAKTLWWSNSVHDESVSNAVDAVDAGRNQSDWRFGTRASAAAGALGATGLDDTRVRRPGACRRPQARAKAAQTGARARTSLDRPERGPADPSPSGTSIRACAPVRGRRAADVRRHAIGLLSTGVPPEAPWTSSTSSRRPVEARRDDLIALPIAWVVAPLGGATP